MKPIMLAFFLCTLLWCIGCNAPQSANNAPESPKVRAVVGSTTTCCGKKACLCEPCQCCGACEGQTREKDKK